jgi:hypothetical protein
MRSSLRDTNIEMDGPKIGKRISGSMRQSEVSQEERTHVPAHNLFGIR